LRKNNSVFQAVLHHKFGNRKKTPNYTPPLVTNQPITITTQATILH